MARIGHEQRLVALCPFAGQSRGRAKDGHIAEVTATSGDRHAGEAEE